MDLGTGAKSQHSRERRTAWRHRGQGLVEFMLVLPVLLLITLGVVEFGRLFAIYSMVTSASREAARYGASVGDNGSGTPRYLDCAGMRAAAKRMSVLTTLGDSDIQITFDHGDTSSVIATCDSHPIPGSIALGDRVMVRVNAHYEPIVPLVNIPVHTITSMTARTILKEIDAGPTATLGGPMVTETPTNTPNPAWTATNTPTPSNTPTATATATAGPLLTPTITNTLPPSPTPLPVPQDFVASINCHSGKVAFDWTFISGLDYFAIYRVDPTPVIQIAIDSNPACNNCDVLPSGETSRTYYVVSVLNSHQSAPSNTSTVTCP
ncbi:MAG: TadE/TadG family type IV pilus assembly protein [Anaerolineales bacterium]|jgi:Flp pilus assembly protein TadG